MILKRLVEQRVLFICPKQEEFFNLLMRNLSVSSLRGILQFIPEVPYSTFKKYYNKKCLLPRNLFEVLCRIGKINLRNLNVTYKEANWGQIIGGKRGMRAMRKKYAFELKKWRAKGMERSPVIGEGNAKRIKIPPTNEKLAELIGAYLGDGTLNKYQLRISGDCRYEGPYYEYLSKIIFELFGIYPSIYRESKRRNTLLLVLSSNKVCSFFKERLNIQYGDKIRNKTVIPPEIIKDNRFSLACLRSLIDTDGSISRRGKNGSQFCIQFTSHNKFLLKQVVKIGKKFDLFTFYDKTGAGTNNWRRIEKYFSLVGSSNLKHIVRFYLRKFKKKTIYRRDAPSFYKQDLYKELTLPFKILAS